MNNLLKTYHGQNTTGKFESVEDFDRTWLIFFLLNETNPSAEDPTLLYRLDHAEDNPKLPMMIIMRSCLKP